MSASADTASKGRQRGTGTIYQQRGSTNWWIGYFLHGEKVHESSGSTDRKDAERLLKQRLKEVHVDELGARRFVGPKQEKITVGELLDALVADYELSKKMTPQVRSHLKPVRVVFGDRKAVTVTAEMVDAFIQTQLAEGYTNASVNRRTQLLGQAFRLAIERNHLTAMPKIRRLDERGNVRHGFFETPEFEAVVSHLPDTLLRELIRLDFIVGWRKGELPSVRWSNVDGGAIRLRAEDSKTREPRVLPLVGTIKEIIDRCRAKRQYVNDKGIVCLSEYVFHIQGTPIKEYRKTWKRACKKAGVPGKLVHDFRRTAVRNMEQAGVPRSVAMKITGHKTESVYRRYAIVSPKDLGDAIGRIDNYLAGQSKEPTVVPLPVKVQAKRP